MIGIGSTEFWDSWATSKTICLELSFQTSVKIVLIGGSKSLKQHTLHFVITGLGGAIFTAGVIVCMQCIQIYVVDTYATFAASALATVTVLRSIFGTVFPLFDPVLYKKLGYNWGNMVLISISVVLGWPATILLWKYGPILRAKSPYAAEKGTADEKK
jgi:hypothetical protein